MSTRDLCWDGAKRPEGIRVKDIPLPRTTVTKAFSRLVKMGIVFKAGSHLEMRYFTDPDRAKAFGVLSITEKASIDRRRVRMGHKPVGTRAGWGPDDPVRITGKTKVTICPTPARALYSNTYPRY
jgi:hypothetical protein